MSTNHPSLVTPLFRWIVNHPKRIALLGLLVIVAFATQVPNITQDTRSDAFLADDNPALVYRDKVKAIFGLSDPMVIAVASDSSIFTVDALNAVQAVTEIATDVANIDPDGVKSLATENNIIGTDDGMEVEAFYEAPLSSADEAIAVRDAIRDFPLYQGSMVARDETATLVIAELLDEQQAEQTYDDLLQALNQLQLPEGVSLYVAGEGAISGYLGSYISSDAQRLNPLAALIITIIVFLAFLRFSTTLAANLIIASSVLLTVGTMAMSGVPFYVITNALPVILIGISVADTIHIYSEYFERRALHPEESVNDAIVFSMESMWRPITLTTLTTAAGFLGLYFAAYMPPFKSFGLFTAFGVTMAWLYSMLFLPALMAILKSKVQPGLAKKIASQKHDFFAKAMVLLGIFTRRYARGVVTTAGIVIVVGVVAASQLIVNEERIETFNSNEPLYKADKVINNRFDGSNYLDVVIETPTEEGIFEPEVLRKIEQLQAYAETLPNVNGSTSVVDYLKQMNRALNEGQASEYKLPDNKDLVAQYFLLYSASSEPTDFEEEIDYDYRLANVRINMNTGAFNKNRDVVETMETYLQAHFNDEQVTGTLSGRVNLTYHWIKDLGVSHFTGVAIALLLVWLVSSLLFGSTLAGAFALLPVATSILLVYSAMVGYGIPLGIGTSMFAAVAIGLGVDFAIHTIDRLRHLYQQTHNMDKTLAQFYPSTGRALFFNLLAIALGFGVLISSKVVPLNNFGTIVAISVTTSFFISMTLLPALALLFKPRFITGHKIDNLDIDNTGITLLSPTTKTVIAVSVVSLVGWMLVSEQALADNSTTGDLPEGRWVMQQVNNVDDGDAVSRKLTMKMIDKRGKERVRETVGYRKYFGEEKRTVLFYLTPRNVKDTGFLTYDYPSIEVDDDQWLYLPALRKSRRISASDRGDYFLGTDFSYDDIKKEGKIEINDYQFTTLRQEVINGKNALVVEGIPVDKETAKELGYGRVVSWIDTSNWVVIRAKYWDIKLNELKTLDISDIRQVEGIWTRHQLYVQNHKTGHMTQFVFSDVDYSSPVKDTLFTRQALSRGAR
ncbi:outer membrane lipoprotein-sorting protein [Maricurvus nonylphenolicus]|uniref:outer membrane lipoprotein-sorting protein n=1 Tax=Maricurvus nonylphenolicus TaxID=1008307 RepID=UPI0036F24A2F